MDQSEWKANAVWAETPPTLAELWACLTERSLPQAFRDHAARLAEVHPLLRRARREADAGGALPSSLGEAKARFLNLPSGRFTEILFDRTHRIGLGDVGIDLQDNRAARSFIDFTLRSDSPTGFRLPINTKNAGVPFRAAERYTGLRSEDTIPVAAYKAFGSEAAEPLLLYVFLIDWDLLARLRAAYWEALTDPERRVFRLLASARGMSRDLEDAFMDSTVMVHFDELRTAVGYADVTPDFRVVSAARVRSYLLLKRERTPGVFVQQLGTEPAVHISVSNETTPMTTLIERHLATEAARSELLVGLRRTTTTEAPDPVL